MNHRARIEETASESLPQDVNELMAAVMGLPENYRAQLGPIMQRVAESTRRRKRILGLVQDALGQLRLDMKYLVFDLEATRRERDAFQGRLEREQE